MARQIIWKKIRGKYGPYAYLYESFRDATGVPRKRFIKYLGSEIPFGTKIAHPKQNMTPALRKTQKKPKGHRRQRIRKHPTKAKGVCVLPKDQECPYYTICVEWKCKWYRPINKAGRKR